MFGSKNPGNIACFLNCLGVLEETNSQLFEELSNRTTVSEVKAQLLMISKGNKTESELLLGLGNELGCLEPNKNDCKRRLKPVCDVLDSTIKKVKKKKQITAKELSQFLLTIEQSGGAMQFLQIQAETFMFMANEISKMYKMDMESFNNYIQEIAAQVEEHIELLEEVKTKLAELTAEKEKDPNRPKVKYQNPDAWYPPSIKTQV